MQECRFEFDMLRVVAMTNGFNFQMLNYICTLKSRINRVRTLDLAITVMFLFEKEYKQYEYFDYLIVITYIHLVIN